MTEQILQRAQILISQNNYDQAEKELSGAIAAEPDNAFTLSMLAEVKLSLDKTDEALSLIDSAIGLEPDISMFYFIKAKIFAVLKKYKESGVLLDQAFELDPLDADIPAFRASIKLNRKKYQEALDFADMALQLDAENILALNMRSAALVKLNKKKEAHQTIEGALREDPNNSYTHANYGWNLLETGEHKKALEHFKEALKNNPGNDYAQAGMLEALKAKYIFYKLYLMYYFWVNKMSAKSQWLLIFGLFIGTRILRALAKAIPAFEPYIFPLLVIYGLFAFSTWIIHPLTNVLLRFNKYGRFLLDENEIKTSNMVGISFLIFIFSIPFYILTQNVDFVLLGIWGLTMILPLARYYSPSKSKYIFKIFAISLAVIGLSGVFLNALTDNVFNLPVIIYLFGFIAFQWIANYFGIKESNE